MDILEMLRAKVGFTGTEIKIADYILGHHYQVSGMSANALAKETFSSNASVIRMCRKMGLSGYREFQISLAVRLSKQENQQTRSNEYDFTAGAVAPSAIMKLFAETIIDAANNCLNRVSQESLLRASILISNANRLFIYGAGSFNALALCQLMSGLGIASIVPCLSNEYPARNIDASEDDVALFIGYSRDALRGLKKEMTFLRKRGCRIVAISMENSCPDTDINICFPQDETQCPCTETAYLQAALLYITTCLHYLISAKKDASPIQAR